MAETIRTRRASPLCGGAVALGLVTGGLVAAPAGQGVGDIAPESPIAADAPGGRTRADGPDALPPTVFADGTGLPPGSGTARTGAPLYAERCAGCHGASGEGARAVELVGDRALLASDYPDRGIAVYWPYAPPLFDYVRRAMPPDTPYSLSADETYAVVARVLELNVLVDADTRVDAAFLSTLAMPNADGFERAAD